MDCQSDLPSNNVLTGCNRHETDAGVGCGEYNYLMYYFISRCDLSPDHIAALPLPQDQDCARGSVRLQGGNSTHGRVEVCVEGVWGTLCGSFGDNSLEARSVCALLGHASFGMLHSRVI